MLIYQLFKYPVALAIDGIYNRYTHITIHVLKPRDFFAFKLMSDHWLPTRHVSSDFYPEMQACESMGICAVSLEIILPLILINLVVKEELILFV